MTPSERERAIRRVLYATLVLNIAVAAGKVVVGRSFNLLSMTADGVHSSLDGFNNIIGLVVLASAHRPPDADHPYGHRKYETFAALGIAVVLVTVGVAIVREAIERVTVHTSPVAHPATFAVMGATMALNGFVQWWEAREGRRLASAFLVADSQHTRSDIFVSLSVLCALGAIAAGYPALDLVAAFVVAAFIGVGVFQIARENVNVLVDAAVIDPREIEPIVCGIAGVRSCHKVRTRGPRGHVFVDLHIQVDAYLTTIASHQIVHEVADALRTRVAGVEDVVIHTEPDLGAPDVASIDPVEIERVARAVEGVRGCHKIRTRGARGAVAVDLHIQVDPEMTTAASHALGHKVGDALKRELAGVADVLVHAEPWRGEMEGG